MKRILVVAPSNKGTIAWRSLALYKMLAQDKDICAKCVIVHKFKDGYAECEDFDYWDDAVQPLFRKVFAGISQIVWLRRIKKEFKPDTTVSTLISCNTISILSGGKDYKIGNLRGQMESIKNLGFFQYAMIWLQVKYLFPKFDKLYCVSAGVKKSIERNFPRFRKGVLEVVYNNHSFENIINLSKEVLSDEENMVFSNPTIMFCGRIDVNKSPDRLVNAFVSASIPDNYQLAFIGSANDEFKQKLLGIAKSKGMEHRIHFLGYQSNPYKFMARSKAVVSSSFFEGLSGVLIESLILETPVITTNSSVGAWEIMSSIEEYDDSLGGIFRTEDGWIVSNLAAKDASKYEVDVCNMAKAIEEMAVSDLKVKFRFKELIKSERIVEKYKI